MVIGKNLSDSLPPALWAVGAGGTGVLEVQIPLQRRWDQTQGKCKSKHSAIVPESLTGTQAPSGNHNTLLFLRTNTSSSFCLLLHTLRASRGFCTAPLCGTGMDCALFLVIRFNSSYCGLNSGWDQSLFSSLFYPLWSIYLICSASRLPHTTQSPNDALISQQISSLSPK